MSKNIDPMHVSVEDLPYIQDRPFLRREFVLQGYGDPLEQDEDGDYTYTHLYDKNDNRVNEGSDDEPDGADPTLEGEGDSPNIQETLPEDQQWEDQMKKAELEDVIDARNEDRDPDGEWYINIVGSGSSGDVVKDDLLNALRNDDLRIAEFRAANPEE